MRYSGYRVELDDWIDQHAKGRVINIENQPIEAWQRPYDGLECEPTLFGLNRFQLYKITGAFTASFMGGALFSPVLLLLGIAGASAYSGRLLYRSYKKGLLGKRREAKRLPESRREALAGVWSPDLGREGKRLPD